jgi:hypothetical protein
MMETETVLETSDTNLMLIWLKTLLRTVAVKASSHMLLSNCFKKNFIVQGLFCKILILERVS